VNTCAWLVLLLGMVYLTEAKMQLMISTDGLAALVSWRQQISSLTSSKVPGLEHSPRKRWHSISCTPYSSIWADLNGGTDRIPDLADITTCVLKIDLCRAITIDSAADFKVINVATSTNCGRSSLRQFPLRGSPFGIF